MVFIPDLFSSEGEQKKETKKRKKKDEDDEENNSYTEQECENAGENQLNPELNTKIFKEVK